MKWQQPEQREKFDYELNAPLPGQDFRRVSEASAEAEGEAFMAMMAMASQQKEAAGGAG